MFIGLREQLKDIIETSLKDFFKDISPVPIYEVEVPKDKSHGDFSSNIALKSAKIFKKSPMKLASEFCVIIEESIDKSPFKEKIEKVDVQKPGFINFYLTTEAAFDILAQIFQEKDDFGRTDFGKGKKIQVEFVSANPTGPLSVAHARQAAVGDALVNVLNFIGFKADREYYVNDEGNQINILGKSIASRATEILGGTDNFPEEGYQGEYIYDITRKFLKDKKIKDIKHLRDIPIDEFSQYGVEYLMVVIKNDLDDFGVHFDIWSYQSKLASEDYTKAAVDLLKGKGYIYEKEGALWFRSTEYNDDKDRVLQKSDGDYTYLAPDIAYHKNKYERGYEKIVNIWGPDHHGYISRLKAAVLALGHDKDSLEILIVQLATIYRQGKPVSMSTRRGQYISLREVIDEVGVDAARFFFLMRSISAHLDFDLELAKKETPENPVYYIQYAHARINSILKKAKEARITAKAKKIKLLKESEEIDLIKKIGTFPDILVLCYNQRDVFSLVNYLMELGACFHKFYDIHRVIDTNNTDLSSERLALINATRIIFANGLRLLGVSAPKKM